MGPWEHNAFKQRELFAGGRRARQPHPPLRLALTAYPSTCTTTCFVRPWVSLRRIGGGIHAGDQHICRSTGTYDLTVCLKTVRLAFVLLCSARARYYRQP
jgi:hypothetical protein